MFGACIGALAAQVDTRARATSAKGQLGPSLGTLGGGLAQMWSDEILRTFTQGIPLSKLVSKSKKALSSFRAKLQAETGEWLKGVEYSSVSIRDELQKETDEWLKE